MRLVYIAGPYRAATPAGVSANIERARLRAADALRAGHAPITPHQLSRGNESVLTEEDWQALLLVVLRVCEEVWLVEGWESSEGTWAEVRAALAADLPVYLPDDRRLHEYELRAYRERAELEKGAA